MTQQTVGLESVSLEGLLAAAELGRAPFAAESAGYLALAIADQLAGAPMVVSETSVSLAADGSVRVMKAPSTSTIDAERAIRGLLGSLLSVAPSPTPALGAAARRTAGGGVEALVAELEGALIPVNRGAARRALARLARETSRVDSATAISRRRARVSGLAPSLSGPPKPRVAAPASPLPLDRPAQVASPKAAPAPATVRRAHPAVAAPAATPLPSIPSLDVHSQTLPPTESIEESSPHAAPFALSLVAMAAPTAPSTRLAEVANAYADASPAISIVEMSPEIEVVEASPYVSPAREELTEPCPAMVFEPSDVPTVALPVAAVPAASQAASALGSAVPGIFDTAEDLSWRAPEVAEPAVPREHTAPLQFGADAPPPAHYQAHAQPRIVVPPPSAPELASPTVLMPADSAPPPPVDVDLASLTPPVVRSTNSVEAPAEARMARERTRVDELLEAFRPSDSLDERAVGHALKRTIGLEPTPPPPGVAVHDESAAPPPVEPSLRPPPASPASSIASGPPGGDIVPHRPRAPRLGRALLGTLLLAMVAALVVAWVRFPWLFTGHLHLRSPPR